MGRTTRFGLFCVLVSVIVLLLASFRGVTGLEFGLPALISGGILAIGVALDRRARRSRPVLLAVNWAEEFTARVRQQRADMRRAAIRPMPGSPVMDSIAE